MSVHASAPPTRRAATSARVSPPPRRAASSARRRGAAHTLARQRAERVHTSPARARATTRARLWCCSARSPRSAMSRCRAAPPRCAPPPRARCSSRCRARTTRRSSWHTTPPSRRARAEALARLAQLPRREARILHALARRRPSGHARTCAPTLGSDERVRASESSCSGGDGAHDRAPRQRHSARNGSRRGDEPGGDRSRQACARPSTAAKRCFAKPALSHGYEAGVGCFS